MAWLKDHIVFGLDCDNFVVLARKRTTPLWPASRFTSTSASIATTSLFSPQKDDTAVAYLKDHFDFGLDNYDCVV